MSVTFCKRIYINWILNFIWEEGYSRAVKSFRFLKLSLMVFIKTFGISHLHFLFHYIIWGYNISLGIILKWHWYSEVHGPISDTGIYFWLVLGKNSDFGNLAAYLEPSHDSVL